MTQIEESAGQPPDLLYGPLLAGIEDISQQRKVTLFTYTRRVLPLDGYVFWLRTGTFEVTGVIHHSIRREQSETDTSADDTVMLTTNEQIVRLNDTATDTLIVGIVEGTNYAFGSHGWYNDQAGIWHYSGTSVDRTTVSQFITDPGAITSDMLIVSDSLPAWLSLASYTPVWMLPTNPEIALYPSFLVPDNLAPPYGSVHIEPEGIATISAAPLLRSGWAPLLDGFGNPVLDGNGDPILRLTTAHSQLVTERVRVTLYGCDNATALAFLDAVNRYSDDQNVIGIMNMPAVRDGKRPFSEGMVIAQMKVIDFQISYVQSAVYDQAFQLILSAFATVIPYPDT